MPGSNFVPARSSRHRTAALALYRALIRAGKAVPLPAELHHAGTHPIASLVCKQFSRNRKDTSPRLVYASLASGYKFLTVFTKAQAADSPEHSYVVDYLRKHTASTPAPKPSTPENTPLRPPLLTRVSGPGEHPAYVSTERPRPKSAFKGERHVPHVDVTSHGVTFLRVRKPQPVTLSRYIGRQNRRYVDTMSAMLDIENYDMPNAELEDAWERMVRKQAKVEGIRHEPDDEPLSRYTWSEHLNRLWYERSLNERWEDWIARGKVLNKIVQEERALFEKEQQMAKEADSDARVGNVHTGVEGLAQQTQETTLPRPPQEHQHRDPYLSPSWLDIVRKAEEKQCHQR